MFICFSKRIFLSPFFCTLHDSRTSLLTRLRSTAFLNHRPETPTPNCSGSSLDSLPAIYDTLNGNIFRCVPCLKRRSICFLLFSRSFRDKVNCFNGVKVSKQKASRNFGRQYLVDKVQLILVPSHLKLSACGVLCCGDLQELYVRLQFACACGIHEPFYGVYDEAGMYVS